MTRQQTWTSVLLLIPLAMNAARAAVGSTAMDEAGPVLHYTFDAGEGDRVIDHSGYGHEGVIHGATWIRSPRGHALHFDGVDDYVDCGPPQSLNLSGDLTIEAWIRPTAIDGRNRLIFGDASSRTIHRNFNLRIDRGELRFEHGDDVDWSAVVIPGAVRVGRWQHVAVLCEPPRYFVYCNGELMETGAMPRAIAPTAGGRRRVGGWFAGYFQGDIDELRLYNRALPERVVRAHAGAGGEVGEPAWESSHELRFTRRELHAEAFCRRLNVIEGRAEFRILSREKDLLSASTPVRETRPGSERGAATATLDIHGLEAGDYRLSVRVTDADGRVVAHQSQDWRLPGAPFWFHTEAGRTDDVPAPWTPVRLTRRERDLTVGVTDREYRVTADSPLAQVSSLGAQVLAAPLRMHAEVDGQPVRWQPRELQVEREMPGEAAYTLVLDGGGLTLRVKGSVAFDGFYPLDWRLRAERPCSL